MLAGINILLSGFFFKQLYNHLRIANLAAMIRGLLSTVCQLGFLAALLFTFLFGKKIGDSSSAYCGPAIREIISAIRDVVIQWLVIISLFLYFATFSVLELRSSYGGRRWLFRNSLLWQCVFVGVIVAFYAFDHRAGSVSTTVVVLLAGIVLGKCFSAWVYRKSDQTFMRIAAVIGLLVIFFAIAMGWQSHAPKVFQYREVSRWSGPLDSPNLFGLLMGTGLVLSLSVGVRECATGAVHARKAIFMLICFAAALLSGWGLFKSYSRGAWLATAAGTAYLCWFKHEKSRHGLETSPLWFARNWKPLAVIGFALVAFSFWQFRFTGWNPARRFFSVANVNDFSWRNRVTAWKGAGRMIADRPWTGFGWEEAELIYGKKYSPPQIENGAAIQMNDFFTLGISAGVPALVCFLMYVGLSLRSPKSIRLRDASARQAVQPQLTRGPDFEVGGEGRGLREQIELDWLQATCRAGAIVLLVGFFFDGGLFKLATGSVFWILLELGRVNFYRKDAETQKAEIPIVAVQTPVRDYVETGAQGSAFANASARLADAPYQRKRWEVWLRRSTWILGIAAISESAVFLATPFFGVNNATLAISRHYLVPPSAVGDLNLLAANVDWSSRKLRPLLQHSSLANYNRQLINWKLEDQTYREFVLNPLIDPVRDGQVAWRRKLWEYFYLPMRKENDPASAAQIVLKFLHQRIAIVPQGRATIDEMWQQKQADERGIQALEVAAFRSVGVPARLDERGQAELFSDGKWLSLVESTPSASRSIPVPVK